MSDSETTIAQVRQQVIGLERGHTELRQELHSVEQKMDRGFSAITAKLDEKTTPQWQPIGILITVLIAIGGALYMPIRENSNKHEATIEALRGVTVPRAEHDRLWRDAADDQRRTEDRIRRLWEEQTKTAKDLGYLQGQLHPLQK